MQEYDIALKLALGSAEETMRELTGGAVYRWLNVELPEVRGSRVDLLGESDAGELVHIELQSTNDPKMPLRMAEYCLRVYRLFGRFPRQILLYVGEEPMTMAATLTGPSLDFRYRAMDIRELDGERLLESARLGDNVIAILARLRDGAEAVRRIVARIAAVEAGQRAEALSQLLILAGLRRMAAVVEQEVKRVPILNDILDHEVLGREYKKGRGDGVQEGVQQGAQQEALTMLRGLLEERFGVLPAWAEQKLVDRSIAELEKISRRVLKARSIEELFS